MKKIVVVFDLDDTLYAEIDFLKSAYKHIAKLLEVHLQQNIYDEMWQLYQSQQSTFDVIKQKYSFPFSIADLVHEYRFHQPQIDLVKTTQTFLDWVKKNTLATALITDGRSITQRNKIRALGLEKYFDEVFISEETGIEKPNIGAFMPIEIRYHGHKKIFIADNPKKDFIAPNELGWTTIALKNKGQNIHQQDWNLPKDFLPKFYVAEINEAKNILLNL